LNKLTILSIITILVIVGVSTVYLAIIAYGWSGNNYQYSGSAAGASWYACPMNRGRWSTTITANRLDITEVTKRLESYVESLGNNYAVLEIMEFSNNFYAVIIEKDTSVGAFELLVDPYTGAIMPEPGPNMMWNTKYGMHFRMMYRYYPTPDEMIIDEDEAKQIALRYLTQRFQGSIGLEEPIKFYGYYTIDYTINNRIHGMLSVNAFSGDVWYHSWHGEFIQEIEVEENE